MEPDDDAPGKILQRGMTGFSSSSQEARQPSTFQRLRRAMSMKPATEDGETAGRQPKRGSTIVQQPANGVFPDPDSVKEAVRDLLEQKKYNVQDFYKTEGICQRLARSPLFDYTTLSVIIVNALWIAVDTDYNDQDLLIYARPEFQIMENLFCAFFTAELIIRYGAFRRSWDAFRDMWFVFDAVILVFMIFETWIITVLVATIQGLMMLDPSLLSLVRLLRLFRMTRVVRVLKAFPELMILLKGMLAAFRSVLVTLGLLLIVTYVYSIAFTSLCKGLPSGAECESYFPNVWASMFTCIVRGALLDEVTELLADVGRDSGLIVAIFFSYVLIAAVTVMNLLIGVLCEVVTLVAAAEREELLIGFVQGQLEKIVASVDLDGNGLISHKEMKAILQDKDAVRALHSVGVDPVSLVDLADVLFPTKVAEDGDEFRGEMTFIQFMQELLELRGKNTATVKDMITLRKIMKVQQEDLLEAIGQLESSVLGSADELQQTAQRKQGSRRNLESPEREQLSPTLSQQPRVLEGQLIDEELSQKMLELRQILDATLSSVILNGRSIDKPIESRDPAAGALRATAAEESVRKPGKHEDLFLEDVPGMQELEALERVLSQRHLQAEKPRQQLLPGQPRGVSSDI